MEPRALFAKICEMSGVSAVLAPGLVRRALLDGGVDPDTATAADYRQALPRLTARLRAYLPDDEAARRVRRITGFLVHADSQIEPEDDADYSIVGRVTEALRAGTPASGVDLADNTTGRRMTAEELEIVRRARLGDSAEYPIAPGTDAGADRTGKTKP